MVIHEAGPFVLGDSLLDEGKGVVILVDLAFQLLTSSFEFCKPQSMSTQLGRDEDDFLRARSSEKYFAQRGTCAGLSCPRPS